MLIFGVASLSTIKHRHIRARFRGTHDPVMPIRLGMLPTPQWNPSCISVFSDLVVGIRIELLDAVGDFWAMPPVRQSRVVQVRVMLVLLMVGLGDRVAWLAACGSASQTHRPRASEPDREEWQCFVGLYLYGFGYNLKLFAIIIMPAVKLQSDKVKYLLFCAHGPKPKPGQDRRKKKPERSTRVQYLPQPCPGASERRPRPP